MTDAVIGTAKVVIEVDTRQYEIAVQRAEDRTKGMSKDMQAEYNKLDAASKKSFQSLQRSTDMLGLDAEARNVYRISLMKEGELKQSLLARYKATETALQGETRAVQNATKAFNSYGMSQKQVDMAMRQVPAQMTDIFVSLAGGQNPMMVLIQQGGQLKDIFGGIAPAARALGGAIMGLINPYTMLATAVGVLALAWYKADQDTRALQNSLVVTGNTAGLTAGQLDGMRDSLVNINVSGSDATAAILKVGESGKFTGEQMRMVAQAATEWSAATGAEIDQTVEMFAKMRGQPLTTLVEMNDKYHFLTEGIYRQVKALEEQGRHEEAVNLAMRASTAALTERAVEVNSNVNGMAEHWRNLKVIVVSAWDAIKDAMKGAQAGDEQRMRIQSAVSGLKSNAHMLRTYGANYTKEQIDGYRKMTEMYKKQIADAQGELARDPAIKAAQMKAAHQRSEDGAIAFDMEVAQYRSDAYKRAERIKKIEGAAQEQIALAMKIGNKTRADNIRAQAKMATDAIKKEGEKKPASNKSAISAARQLESAQSKLDLQQFRDTLAQEQNAIQNNRQILQAEYSAKLVSVEDYYARTRELMAQDLAAQEKSIQGQIAVLRERGLAGKDAVNNQKEIGKLEAQLVKARSDASAAAKVQDIQERVVLDNKALAALKYADSLREGTDALAADVDLRVASVALGEKELSRIREIANLRAWAADEQKKLDDKLRQDPTYRGQYDIDTAKLKAAVDERVDIVTRGFERMDQAQQDWLGGLQKGMLDWTARAADVATQTAQLAEYALDRTADGLADAALTGKLAWRDMLGDIGKEIVKFMMKQAVLKFVQYFAQMWGNNGGTARTGDFNVPSSDFRLAAKGDVFASPSLSKYSNTVQSSPTPFYFAKGAGIFGEAGPEAVMPLTRTADGNLGVRTVGGQKGVQQVSIMVQTNITNEGVNTKTQGTDEQYKAVGESLRTLVHTEVNRMMMPGGKLYRAGVTA